MKRRLTMAIGLSATTGLIGFGTTVAYVNGPGKLARLAAE